MESTWSGHPSNDEKRPGHRIQRMGASRSARFVFVTQWRLAPGADAERSTTRQKGKVAEAIGTAAGGPPDRAKMTEIFRRHGMTVAAPPSEK